MRLRILTFVATLLVGGLLWQSCRIMSDLAQSERMDAVGGRDTYIRGRVAALTAIKEKISIGDPAVRQREIDEIDRQITEVENETTDEMGSEMRRVK